MQALCKQRAVVFVDTSPLPSLGSAQLYQVHLADVLIMAGYRVAFAVQSGSGYFHTVKTLSDEVVALDFARVNPRKLASDLGAWVAANFSDCAVCLQGSEFYANLVATYAAASHPWLVAWTEWGSAAAPQGQATAPHAGALVSRMTKGLVARLAVDRADFHVVPSRAAAQAACERGAKLDTIRLVAPAISVQSVQLRGRLAQVPKQLEGLAPGLRVGYVGRFDEASGVQVALEAFMELADGREDLAFALAGAGPLGGSCEERLERWAAQHKDTSRFALCKPLDSCTFLSALDILCVPAALAKPSFAVLEAQALGVAIVALAADEAGLIEADKTAVVAAERSACGLAQALRRAADDERLRAACCAQALRRVEERHDYAAFSQVVERIYDQAFSGVR